MIKVPFLDLSVSYRELQEQLNSAVQRVLNSGWYILGEEVEAFEQEFANYCGAKYCIGVGNGLDALTLSLRAMGVVAGDEVIVPTNTYIATWLAVSQLGAVPVPVEPKMDTYNLNLELLEKAITTKTKVIIPVHLYGQPVDLDGCLRLAKKYDLQVLEDAAQAHGAKYKGRMIGTHGNAVTWSFYPGKNLGALGDAGAITTNDESLAEKLCMLRNYGSKKKYVHELMGMNSRLDPMQAAILREKLQVLTKWNEQRESIANRYLIELAGLPVQLPVVADWAEPVWHLFVIRTKQREELQQFLLKQGVQTQIHYPIPPHLQSAYSDLGYKMGDFPVAEEICNEVLSLPIDPHLQSLQVDWLIQTIKSFQFNSSWNEFDG